MLSHLRNLTLAVLTGLMLGSLNKVWPWKETLTWRVDSHGQQQPLLQDNLLPSGYATVTGQDPQVLLAVLLAVSGVVLVLGLEWVARRQLRQPGHEL
jgi:putative membrane protein